jgi:cyanophycinase
MNTPKGKLIAIGGNEAKNLGDVIDKDHELDLNDGVLRDILREMKPNPIIQILPLASQHQEEISQSYHEAFGKLGIDISLMIIRDKKEVDDTRNLKKLQESDGIFMTGGDQTRLMKMLEGTDFVDIMKQRYLKDNFIIAGTSAGAMVMSEFMIQAGGSEESLIKGTVELASGFGFLPGTIIDTHFLERGRFSRLTEALCKKSKFTGVGLSEDTGVVITGGKQLRVIGTGTVIVIESDEIKNTNYSTRKLNEPVFIENLVIHILSKGTSYILKEKKFLVQDSVQSIQ